MNPRSSLLLACILAAGSTQTQADVFTWIANSGMWENPSNWVGPNGQYPDSTVDSATITGSSVEVLLNANLGLGGLNVLGGSALLQHQYSLFIDGDALISGIGSRIAVRNSPAIRDFDVDTLQISGGLLEMAGGTAQIDDELRILGSGGVTGVGTIEMDSTTGDIVMDGGGVIWASGGNLFGDTLTLRHTEDSTSELDWTDANSHITVWDGKTIHNQLPYSGALGGRIWVSGSNGTTRYISDDAFVAGNGSELKFSGGDLQSTARIEAPLVDSYGLIHVSGVGVIDSPIVVMRGEVELGTDAFLTVPADLLVFSSLDISASGEGSTIQLAQPGSTLNITGGVTSVDMGVDSHFDLDGAGDKVVNIDDDSTLSLAVDSIDTGGFPSFGGTLNIEGALHVETVGESNSWQSNGEIVLDQGEITGRAIINTGVIRGTGYIDSFVSNAGEIVAESGTLEIRISDIDGGESVEAGILRAQTGDLVINPQGNGATHYFTGSIYVGDGIGIREVLQMNMELIMQEDNGVTGSMDLNSGFVVLHDFLQRGDLLVQGTSQIRTTGTESADRISFASAGVNTITGELEVDGETWFVPGAEFNGEGTINAVSTIKRTFFQDDSDLGDVGFESSGQVHLFDFFNQGRATVGSLILEPSSSLMIDLGDFNQPITSDRLIVRDSAQLAGKLVLNWDGQGQAPIGETAVVLQAGSITGVFDAFDDSQLGDNRRAFVTVNSDSVEVFVTCSADLNADGHSNFFDVSMFLQLFSEMDPLADINEDGHFNFFDVSQFLSAIELGC